MPGEEKKSVFGRMFDGTEIYIFTLQQGDMKARIMNYGARLVSLDVPDRSGNIADVVLGYDSLTPYTTDSKTYFGAVVGRYANRIANGAFALNGKRYLLPRNDDSNSLHGGTQGFDKRVWAAHAIEHGVELKLVSENGDQGYPGTLTTRVRYTLNQSTLRIEYFASTDEDTVLNLTNHTYFNLAGEGHGTVLEHFLRMPAEYYTPINAHLIPTGQLASVIGTPFNFLKSTAIGDHISEDNEQLHMAKGYDENFVLPESNDKDGLHEAACISEPKSGRVLVVRTTQPGVQFYSGNFLDGTSLGKQGHVYGKHSGLCLETQHFPDSPNHSGFPTTELKSGQIFHSVTEYIFSKSN